LWNISDVFLGFWGEFLGELGETCGEFLGVFNTTQELRGEAEVTGGLRGEAIGMITRGEYGGEYGGRICGEKF